MYNFFGALKRFIQEFVRTLGQPKALHKDRKAFFLPQEIKKRKNLSTNSKTLIKNATAEVVRQRIIESLQDVKGKNIVQLDLRELDSAPTDFFIICEGESHTQVQALADRVYRNLKDEFRQLPLHYEGYQHAHWICLDYFNVVVHVFYPEARAFYRLEQLWSDALVTEYASL